MAIKFEDAADLYEALTGLIGFKHRLKDFYSRDDDESYESPLGPPKSDYFREIYIFRENNKNDLQIRHPLCYTITDEDGSIFTLDEELIDFDFMYGMGNQEIEGSHFLIYRRRNETDKNREYLTFVKREYFDLISCQNAYDILSWIYRDFYDFDPYAESIYDILEQGWVFDRIT